MMPSLGLDTIQTLAGLKLNSTLATYITAGILNIIPEDSSIETGDRRDRTEDITTEEWTYDESPNSYLHMCTIGGWRKL